jgi:hypothetical protein
MKRSVIIFLVVLAIGSSVYIFLAPKYVCIDIVLGHEFKSSSSIVEMCAPEVGEENSRDMIKNFRNELSTATGNNLDYLIKNDRNAQTMGSEKYRKLFLPLLKKYLNYEHYLAFSIGSQTVNILSTEKQKVVLIFDEKEQLSYSSFLKDTELEQLITSLALREVDVDFFTDYFYALHYVIKGERQWFADDCCYFTLSKNAVYEYGVDEPAWKFINDFLASVKSDVISPNLFVSHNDYNIFSQLLKADSEFKSEWKEATVERVIHGDDMSIVIINKQSGKDVIFLTSFSGSFQVFGLFQDNPIKLLIESGKLEL